MSSQYPIEMGGLMLAMRDAAIEDDTTLPYLKNVKLWMRGWEPAPTSDYSLYIMPMGSPTTEVAEHSNTSVIYVDHLLVLTAVIRVAEPGEEGQVVGRSGANVGITEFVSDLIKFFDGNLLGLESAGLEVGSPPQCEAPADCYDGIQIEDEEQRYYLVTARLLYRAQTQPFNRTAS